MPKILQPFNKKSSIYQSYLRRTGYQLHFEKLILSLLSPLPNEQDFAINVCALLSMQEKSVSIKDCKNVLYILLAHAGVFKNNTLKLLFNDYYDRIRELPLMEFWCKIIPEELLENFPFLLDEKLISDNYDFVRKKLIFDKYYYYFNYDLIFSKTLLERVKQVTDILLHLTNSDDNINLFVKEPTFFRFLSLCLCSKIIHLKKTGWHIAISIASEIKLFNPYSDFIINFVLNSLHSDDRGIILYCLQFLTNINENLTNLNHYIQLNDFKRICSFLTLDDVLLIVRTLDCLYSLSSKFDVNRILIKVNGILQTLLSLLTYNPSSQSCYLLTEQYQNDNFNIQNNVTNIPQINIENYENNRLKRLSTNTCNKMSLTLPKLVNENINDRYPTEIDKNTNDEHFNLPTKRAELNKLKNINQLTTDCLKTPKCIQELNDSENKCVNIQNNLKHKLDDVKSLLFNQLISKKIKSYSVNIEPLNVNNSKEINIQTKVVKPPSLELSENKIKNHAINESVGTNMSTESKLNSKKYLIVGNNVLVLDNATGEETLMPVQMRREKTALLFNIQTPSKNKVGKLSNKKVKNNGTLKEFYENMGKLIMDSKDNKLVSSVETHGKDNQLISSKTTDSKDNKLIISIKTPTKNNQLNSSIETPTSDNQLINSIDTPKHIIQKNEINLNNSTENLFAESELVNINLFENASQSIKDRNEKYTVGQDGANYIEQYKLKINQGNQVALDEHQIINDQHYLTESIRCTAAFILRNLSNCKETKLFLKRFETDLIQLAFENVNITDIITSLYTMNDIEDV